MGQKTLEKWLKVIIVGMGICGLIIYAVLVPAFGKEQAVMMPEFAYCYYPWLIFLWITGIPCYAALALGWRIAGSIGRNESFTLQNAGRLKAVAVLAAGDSVFFLAGNITYLFLDMNHPGIVLFSFFVVFMGIVISVVAAALSCLVKNAAKLQEQSDLTI